MEGMSIQPIVLADAQPLQAVLAGHVLRPGDFLVRTYLSTLRSPMSRASMSSSLRTVARLMVESSGAQVDPSEVGPDRVDWALLDWVSAAAIKTLLSQRFAPATVNRHLASVRGVVKVAFLTGLMDEVRVGRVRHALTSMPLGFDGASPAGRLVTDRELRELFVHLAGRPETIARRDAAAIAVLSMGAVRRSEAVGLDLADWDGELGELLVRHGKGGKTRKVWLHSGGEAALLDWLAIRGDDPGPLLCRVRRGGILIHGEDGRLTSQAVWRRLNLLTAATGVKHFTPHDLRRKAITDLLDNGDDLPAVQRLAGHANISTTAGYDRRGERAARKAASHLEVPYVTPGALG